jgi:hypothetical protein
MTVQRIGDLLDYSLGDLLAAAHASAT